MGLRHLILSEIPEGMEIPKQVAVHAPDGLVGRAHSFEVTDEGLTAVIDFNDYAWERYWTSRRHRILEASASPLKITSPEAE